MVLESDKNAVQRGSELKLGGSRFRRVPTAALTWTTGIKTCGG